MRAVENRSSIWGAVNVPKQRAWPVPLPTEAAVKQPLFVVLGKLVLVLISIFLSLAITGMLFGMLFALLGASGYALGRWAPWLQTLLFVAANHWWQLLLLWAGIWAIHQHYSHAH